MKKRIFIATFFVAVCSSADAQFTRNNGLVANTNPATAPTNISQFEANGRLITQNAFVGNPGLMPPAQQTGNFNTSAIWNSMGSLQIPLGGQLLNGFRSQMRGKGVTMGFSGPATGTSVSNATIQWIGSQGITGGNVPAGNLEFRFADQPNVPNSDRLLFSMNPRSAVNVFPFCYAAQGALIGQLESGVFGTFNATDIWSASGRVAVGNSESYGTRHQKRGYSFISGLLSDINGNGTTAITDFGNNDNFNGSIIYKFRSFRDPGNPSTIRNIWQSSNKFNNVMIGRQDYGSTNNAGYYLSVFDGQTTNAGVAATSFIDRAGIIAIGNGFDNDGRAVSNYAAVVGDVSQASNNGFAHIGVLGISDDDVNNGGNKWAGYFIGSTFTTGSINQPSDRRFKNDIADEENMTAKLMQLKPKHYTFDTQKNKSMSFSSKLQHGFISQEVEEIFPELVQDVYGPGTPASQGEKAAPIQYKALNYNGFISMLVRGFQEQQAEIESLKKQIASTNTLVINENNKAILTEEIKSSAFSLAQNIPNPFSERSTISYSVPSDSKQALMAIFDLNGKMILQYKLAPGKGQVTINGNQLSAGMYIYSIISDGQEVISKRMVLTK
jgi:hypothetical protein